MSSQIPNLNDQFAVQGTPVAGSSGMGSPIAPQSSSSLSMGSGASESEGIEQEWLDRTHHVMQSFSSDPYQLSKEFAVLRAEFIKHRYGKVIHTNPTKDMKKD